MDTAKPSTRPIMVRVLFFSLLSAAAVAGAVFWGLKEMSVRASLLVQAHPELAEAQTLAGWVETLRRGFWSYGVPTLLVFFLIMAVLTWWSLRSPFLRRPVPTAPRRPAPAKAKPQTEAAPSSAETDRRLYLHLIAVLQKEGRLLDFFSEDLAQYNDGQIGAAVRSIHESCKKVLDRHIAPQSVLEVQEGEEIAVQKDFDPNTLKLVGNVTGEPPFKGVVRHRGWRARKVDLPTFSGRQPHDIIAPAEVEVQ
ncbi:DUF2760 domain-containing protein [Desulfatitalea tepidiphila]|uniref:DUF2760 domain-containing protein n=1 Tax=Desulfatitalea tepidiphila TaxID=1185843 RepID=UPI0013793182|nr:DUF2760 domain-containing protein [Desulfatitalea tepidiphila]